MPRVCPRCEAIEAQHVATAPNAGVWQIYICQQCFFTWRTTEPASVTEPEHYPTVFRVRQAEIHTAGVLPPITPPRVEIEPFREPDR